LFANWFLRRPLLVYRSYGFVLELKLVNLQAFLIETFMLFYRRATSFAPFNDFLFDPQVFYLNRLALPHLEGLHVALFSHLKSVQLIELSAFVDFDFDNKSALDFLVFLEVMQRYKDSFDLFVLRIQNGVKFLGQVVDS
jgi:hypothetical protein